MIVFTRHPYLNGFYRPAFMILPLARREHAGAAMALPRAAGTAPAACTPVASTRCFYHQDHHFHSSLRRDGMSFSLAASSRFAACQSPNLAQGDAHHLRDFFHRLAVGPKTLYELLLFEGSAYLEPFFTSFFAPFFTSFFAPFLEGFLPDASLSDVVELEHSTNLHTVEFVIAPDQHF
jgi:hypothetical protein